MKNIANIISIIRIIFSIMLIYFYKDQYLFLTLYMVCGLSDVFDGYIARKTNTQSSIGAKLDSFADLIMFGTITVIMFILWRYKLKIFLPWIIVTILIRVANIIFTACKYHSIIFIHTWGNKLTGILLFMVPILFIVSNSIKYLWPICIISILSAIEESIIHLTAKEIDLNRKSFLKL